MSTEQADGKSAALVGLFRRQDRTGPAWQSNTNVSAESTHCFGSAVHTCAIEACCCRPLSYAIATTNGAVTHSTVQSQLVFAHPRPPPLAMPGLKSAPPQKAASEKPAKQSGDRPTARNGGKAQAKKQASSNKSNKSPRASNKPLTPKHEHSTQHKKQSTQPAVDAPSKASKPAKADTAIPASTDAVDMEIDEQQPPSSNKPSLVTASNPFLQLFWQLADENETKRQQAQATLLATLTTEQTQHTASITSPPPAADSADLLHPNLRYALKRLLRGVCSSRAAARIGFASCLTAVLQSFTAIPSAFLLSTFTSQLTPPQSPSKQEQTDFKLGHATAVLAVCRGGRVGGGQGVDGVEAMVRRLVREARSKVVRETAWEAVRAVMDSVGWKEYKAWLEPFVLKQLATTDEAEEEEEEETTKQGEQEDGKPKSKKQKTGDASKETAPAKAKKSTTASQPTAMLELSALTPERLSILLTMHDLYRQQQQSIAAALSSSLAPSCLSPLSVAHFGALVDILSSAAYTLPALHSVYERVFAALLTQESGDWVQLFELLAASLFADRTSTARKHQGLLLFGHLVHVVTQSPLRPSLASDVAALLHPLLLRTLLNNFSSPGTHLHSVARSAQQGLLTAARSQPSIILPVLQRLLAAHGRWDSITKSKTVSTLVSLLTTEDLHRYVHTLMLSFHSGEHKQPTADTDAAEEEEAGEADGVERHDLWVLDSLYAATRHAALVDAAVLDVALTERVSRFFLFYGFFDPTTRKQQPPPSTKRAKKRKAATDDSSASAAVGDGMSEVSRTLSSPLSVRVREVCQTRLWSLLDDLLPRSKRQQQQPQVTAEESESVSVSTNILWSQLTHQYWSEAEKAGYALLLPISDDARQARATMLERVASIEEKTASAAGREEKDGDALKEAGRLRARQERGLSVLLLHVGLLQLTEEESATALLQELDMGCQQLWKSSTDSTVKPAKKAKKSKHTVDEQHDESAADEVQPVFIEGLVDILLSLLVRPSALVRNVCKLVFAAWASEVNEQALGDVMRVVVRRAGLKEKTGEAGDDEDDDDFQPFDVNDVDAADDEEEEEEEDEEQGEDVERPVNGKQANKKRKEPSPSSQATGEDEEDDEDDELIDLDKLDDVLGQPLTAEEQSAVDAASAHFNHYDHHLANIIRLRQQNNKTAQDDLIQQQTNFQLRALDLLDIYVKQQPSSRLIMEQLLLPAVDAVKATRKSEKVKGLHERLVALVRAVAKSKQHPTVVWPVETREKELKGKKGKSKGAAKEREPEELVPVGLYETRLESVRTLMSALMERTQHAADSEHVALLSSSILYLVRLSLPASALISTSAHSTLPSAVQSHIDFVRLLYQPALTSYLTTRHSHFNTRFFTDFITTAPAIAIHSLPLLAQLTRTPLPDTETATQPLAATAFLRLDALSFVSLLCAQSKLMAQQPVAVVAEVGRAVGEGVESMLRWVALTDEEKKVVREQERERLQDGKSEGEADEAEDEKDETDVRKLSKEERLKQKQKLKKKRRQQRKKQAAQQQLLATADAASATTTPTAAATDAKITISRLRATLRSAATVAAAMKRAGAAVDSVVSETLKDAMCAMRGSEVAEVRGVMANLLAVAGVGELEVMKRVREEEEAERRQRRLKLQDEAQKERKAKAEAAKADKVEAIKNKGDEKVKKEKREKADKQKGTAQDTAVKAEDGPHKPADKHTAKSEQQPGPANGHANGKATNEQHKGSGKDKSEKFSETGKAAQSTKRSSTSDKDNAKHDSASKTHKKERSAELKSKGEKHESPSNKRKATDRVDGAQVEKLNGHGKDKRQQPKENGKSRTTKQK